MKNMGSYSYSQAYNIRWSLEMELNTLSLRCEDEKILEFLRRRIKQLKEEEKQCLRAQVS